MMWKKAVSQDARIAYRLLLTVNSAAYNLNRKVESLREALVYIGLANLKTLGKPLLLYQMWIINQMS